MQKRKYNGGSLVKQYKGIVDLDARAYGNQDFQGANVTATRKLGSSFTGSIRGSANSKGRSSTQICFLKLGQKYFCNKFYKY